MKCNRCGHEVSAENSYQHLGETLCEDCYINIKYPAKACVVNAAEEAVMKLK